MREKKYVFRFLRILLFSRTFPEKQNFMLIKKQTTFFLFLPGAT
jgi:hypothetical protein